MSAESSHWTIAPFWLYEVRWMSETPTTTTSQVRIAVHFQCLLQRTFNLYCCTSGASERPRTGKLSVLLPFVWQCASHLWSQYALQCLWESTGAWGPRDVPHEGAAEQVFGGGCVCRGEEQWPNPGVICRSPILLVFIFLRPQEEVPVWGGGRKVSLSRPFSCAPRASKN